MVRPLRAMRRKFRRWLVWLWQQEGTPVERAIGLALGAFSGCFPLFGFQTLLGLSLATIFHGNRLLAVIGTWVSNPVTYLPLYWLNYKVGCAVLGEAEKSPDLREITFQSLWHQGWILSQRLMLGSALVGCFVAGFVGVISYRVFKKTT